MFNRLREDNANDPRVRRARRTLQGALAASVAGPALLCASFVVIIAKRADGGIAILSTPEWAALLILSGVLSWAMIVLVRAPWEHVVDLAEDAASSVKSMERGTLEALQALNATVEAKDRYTAGHGLRVTLMSILIGQELGLKESQLDVLRHAATFHDVGKIAVSDGVLLKPGQLTDLEFQQLKVHPVEGARICEKLAVLRAAVPAVRHHHERWDGFGYPDGLSGNAIPVGARIIAVADTWDAITSDRPYRLGQPPQAAVREILRVSGTQFDPRVVDAFVDVLARDPWMFGISPDELDFAVSATESDDPALRLAGPVPLSVQKAGDAPIQLSQDDELDDRDVMPDWSAGFGDAA